MERTISLAILMLCAFLGACGGGSDDRASTPKRQRPFVVYLASDSATPWSRQMIRSAEVAATRGRFQGKVDLIGFSTPTVSVSAQRRQLGRMVRAKPDAILIRAASSDELNPIVETACNAGIVVVSFDSNVSAPCAYKLLPGFERSSEAGAEWLTEQIDEDGEILLEQGRPGDPNAESMQAGFDAVLDDAPNVRVVGRYRNVERSLAAHPDVAGVLTMGPHCADVLAAFKRAGKSPPAVVCHGAPNAALVACARAVSEGAKCFDAGYAPYISVAALRAAMYVLDKTPIPKQTVFAQSCLTTHVNGSSCDEIELGKNALPDAPDSLVFPIAPDWIPLTIDDVL